MEAMFLGVIGVVTLIQTRSASGWLTGETVASLLKKRLALVTASSMVGALTSMPKAERLPPHLNWNSNVFIVVEVFSFLLRVLWIGLESRTCRLGIGGPG